MRLTVVGCSGSFPGPDSAASCYLLEADGFRLVVDMGNGSLGALQRFAPLFGIDAVLLSHLHADHCVDLYSYSVARAYAPAGPQPPIPVYGPAGTSMRIGLVHGPDGDPGLDAAVHVRDACAGRDADRAVRRRARAHEPPGGDVRLPVHPGRPVAGLHRGHGRDRGGARPGQGRGRAALRGGVPRRSRPPAQPAPDRSPGGRRTRTGPASAGWSSRICSLGTPAKTPAKRPRPSSPGNWTWPSPDR